VTFTLHGPADATCTAAPIFTSTVALSSGGTATSAGFSGTTAAGTYNWIASYSGDATNLPSTSKCGAEPVNIVASGVKGITTPGTGAADGIAQAGLGIGLVIGGITLALGSELVRERRRA
jgi:hypothetical protein